MWWCQKCNCAWCLVLVQHDSKCNVTKKTNNLKQWQHLVTVQQWTNVFRVSWPPIRLSSLKLSACWPLHVTPRRRVCRTASSRSIINAAYMCTHDCWGNVCVQLWPQRLLILEKCCCGCWMFAGCTGFFWYGGTEGQKMVILHKTTAIHVCTIQKQYRCCLK